MVTKSRKSVSELFSTDVRGFSIYDCVRSIPSGVDGFKPSQRKIIFGMNKKFSSDEVKVSIANAGIMEVSSFHHGSMESTIVGMAQDYPGTNNVNYMLPIGQFGSRIAPEPAASRYIFVKMSDAFRKIFKKEDDLILQYLEDDGQSIEPEYYLPIIPNVLINGATGMGTGYATRILNYDPEDLRKQCIKYLTTGKTAKLIPWYRGFTGTVEKNGDQTIIQGVYEVVNGTTIKITELPVGTHTIDYRATLNKLEDAGIIKSYDDNSTEEKTEFIISTFRSTTGMSNEELLKKFKLISRETENFTVWTEGGKIKCFDSAEDLLKWFVDFRLTKYEERRLKQIEVYNSELTRLEERIRFIEFYINNSVWFSKATKIDIEKKLASEKFEYIDELMSVRVYNLTKEQIEKLKTDVKGVHALVKSMKATSAKEMYLKELNELKV